MNNNENEFELDGKKYVAVPYKFNCKECAFFRNPICASAPCEPVMRSDKREVIFIEKPKEKTKLEQETCGDRIRRMSNEELASLLSDLTKVHRNFWITYVNEKIDQHKN